MSVTGRWGSHCLHMFLSASLASILLYYFPPFSPFSPPNPRTSPLSPFLSFPIPPISLPSCYGMTQQESPILNLYSLEPRGNNIKLIISYTVCILVWQHRQDQARALLPAVRCY